MNLKRRKSIDVELIEKKMEKIYLRNEYYNRIKGFIDDTSMIKVITGIRRCGKSFFLKSIQNELLSKGIPQENIIVIELDKRGYKRIQKPEQLEELIDSRLCDTASIQYLFIDEIQNVPGYERLVNSYREEGNISIFITGSNSYLLSGDLATHLTGRYIEIEMMPLTFYEYVDMKRFFGFEIKSNGDEFENYLMNGGFPGALKYVSFEDRQSYSQNVIKQIWNKDIRTHNKIKDRELFSLVQKFIINNFGAVISFTSICNYLTKTEKISVDRRTIKHYVDILEKAKIIYPCDLFDVKSKRVLKGERKYYLADLSIYYAMNTDNRINYGPSLENIVFSYLKSKNYQLSVGYIGKLECDFIARESFDLYYYIQVAMTILDSKETENREYAPLESIRDNYPKYVLTIDQLKQRRNGIKHENIIDFLIENKRLE